MQSAVSEEVAVLLLADVAPVHRLWGWLNIARGPRALRGTSCLRFAKVLGSGFDFDLFLHRGAGAYICGEETALMNSLEGLRANPRLKPPFPAASGIYNLPTTINNVESFCAATHILRYGADWYSSMGTEKSKGNKLFQISGPVARPGVFELPLGGLLADTPGFNQPDLDRSPEDLASYFPEIRQRLAVAMCQFNDCKHRDEPGCRVRGEWERYDHYLLFLEEAIVFQSHLNQQSNPDAVMKLKSKKGETQYEPRLDTKKYRQESRRTRQQSLQSLKHDIDRLMKSDEDEGDLN